MMYIVYVIGHSTETMLFEDQKEAYEYATGVAKELGTEANVYRAKLVARAELPTEPILIKIKQQRVVKQEKLDEFIPKVVEKMSKAKKVTKPPVDPIFSDLAADTAIPEDDALDDNVPLGARCALDNNMAVGQRKGPTGEYVYLCVDCMGQLA
jgi:hypothetical protein